MPRKALDETTVRMLGIIITRERQLRELREHLDTCLVKGWAEEAGVLERVIRNLDGRVNSKGAV